MKKENVYKPLPVAMYFLFFCSPPLSFLLSSLPLFTDWATYSGFFSCASNTVALGSDTRFRFGLSMFGFSVLVGEAAYFVTSPFPGYHDTLGLTAYQRHSEHSI